MVKTLFDAIHETTRGMRAIYLKAEPAINFEEEAAHVFSRNGFRRSRHNNQPQCTSIIDLLPDLETVFLRMRKSTRKNIQRSARAGVTVREGNDRDLPVAISLLQHTAKRAGFPERSLKYYQEEWRVLAGSGDYKLHLAEYEGHVIAMSMDAVFSGRCASLHSGSLEEFHHLKANDLLIWEFIKWAKARGCVSYDLWGVPDEVMDYTGRGESIPENLKGGLWGVYYFKQGFE